MNRLPNLRVNRLTNIKAFEAGDISLKDDFFLGARCSRLWTF